MGGVVCFRFSGQAISRTYMLASASKSHDNLHANAQVLAPCFSSNSTPNTCCSVPFTHSFTVVCLMLSSNIEKTIEQLLFMNTRKSLDPEDMPSIVVTRYAPKPILPTCHLHFGLLSEFLLLPPLKRQYDISHS